MFAVGDHAATEGHREEASQGFVVPNQRSCTFNSWSESFQLLCRGNSPSQPGRIAGLVFERTSNDQRQYLTHHSTEVPSSPVCSARGVKSHRGGAHIPASRHPSTIKSSCRSRAGACCTIAATHRFCHWAPRASSCHGSDPFIQFSAGHRSCESVTTSPRRMSLVLTARLARRYWRRLMSMQDAQSVGRAFSFQR